MLQRGLGGPVPEQLHIKMGVGINKARCHHPALGVDLGQGFAVHHADRRDLAVLHGHITQIARRAGAIDNAAAANDQIKHRSSPMP